MSILSMDFELKMYPWFCLYLNYLGRSVILLIIIYKIMQSKQQKTYFFNLKYHDLVDNKHKASFLSSNKTEII